MEYIDILNPDGSPAGFNAARTKVHSEGLYHRSIHLWIINSKGELLVQKRSPSKKAHPGLWDVSCAGHIESGDTPENTVIKETREELGIGIKPEDFRFCQTVLTKKVHKSGTYIDNEYIDIFLMKKDVRIEDINFDRSEVSDVKYISLSDFKALVMQKSPEISPHYEEYDLMLNTVLNVP
jgi:isopentenyl-diphosphate delta-isomerase type 1